MDLTEAVYRSRITLFKVLEARGYSTQQYSKLGINELKVFTTTNYPDNYSGLNMILAHKEDAEKKCIINYVSGKMNQFQRIVQQIENMELNPEKDELIYMIQDSVNDKLHSLVAAHMWSSHKIRVSFFCIYEIIVNPLEHELVPRHEPVPREEIPELLKRIRVNEKTQLPIIRYHTDPIGRLLGLLPGDIVKITRPSPSAGEYIIYRVCLP
jgi:DNA-directed RNA polymerase I, II, and III subunit RPABC1